MCAKNFICICYSHSVHSPGTIFHSRITKLNTLNMVYSGRLITADWETVDFLMIFKRQGIDFFMVTNGSHALNLRLPMES